MSDVILRAEGLAKKYLIGHERPRERYTALRDVMSRAARDLVQSARDMVRGRQLVVGDEVEEYWALKDINFEIRRGDVVGIIGRNGAGKSTLLKILSRITEPSEGRVTIKGRVASLLEVGTGFHPELTGRENIFLNGAILGMTRAEIRRKFDEIVAFADIEKFLDTPVKRYSSGMYVRLAFAVAAHLEPEILIVDEVLAVGDAEFQKKCLGKMRDVAGDGRTVLFVSHNMSAVRTLCERGILLNEGGVELDSDVQSVTSRYLSGDAPHDLKFNAEGRHFEPLEIRVVNGGVRQGNRDRSIVVSGEPFAIELEIVALERCPFSVELLVRDSQHEPVAFCAGGYQRNFVVDPTSEFLKVAIDIQNIDLAGGTYYVDVMIVDTGVKYFDCIDRAISFDVTHRSSALSKWSFTQSRRQGSVLLDAHFSSKALTVDALANAR